MRRRLALLAILPLVSLSTGCITFPDKQEKEPFTQQIWKERQADDVQRLKSEDQRAKEETMHFLDKAGDFVVNTVTDLYNLIVGDTAFTAAKDMLDPSYPDRRRRAVVYLSKRPYGRAEPYTKYYSEMARNDDEPLVRAMAIRALNRSRVKDVTTIYMTALDDKHELVRLEGAKSLGNIPEPLSVPALIKHMNDPEEQVDVRFPAQWDPKLGIHVT